jgi:superoxide dismutase, Cu-Zn family
MKTIGKYLGVILFSLWAIGAYALTIPVFVPTLDGRGIYVGTVLADDTIYGLVLTPKLYHLPPGVHGFAVDTFGNCNKPGGHLDTDKSDRHRGPFDNGHVGDLPVLIVNDKGYARLPVLAPRLKLAYITGRSLVIALGRDNYSDFPKEDGGSGGQLACGRIPYH